MDCSHTGDNQETFRNELIDGDGCFFFIIYLLDASGHIFISLHCFTGKELLDLQAGTQRRAAVPNERLENKKKRGGWRGGCELGESRDLILKRKSLLGQGHFCIILLSPGRGEIIILGECYTARRGLSYVTFEVRQV